MTDPIVPQPTAPYHLFVAGSRDYDVDPPDIGEAIMLRLPFAITLGLPSIISSGVTGANADNYRLCFVAGHLEVPGRVILSVWVCLGFSSARLSGLTANSLVQSLSPDWQACLLPLAFGPQLPPVARLPSPAAFGNQLHIGGFLARKPCFLNIKTYPVTISDNAAFKCFNPPGYLSRAEMRQINRYASISPTMRLNLGNSDDPPVSPGASSNPGGEDNPTFGTRATALPRPPQPPPPPPASASQSHHSSEWYRNVPELAHAIHADDCNSDDDTSEIEYTLLDYMTFLAPGQPVVQAALEEQLAADERRLKKRVAEWAYSIATY